VSEQVAAEPCVSLGSDGGPIEAYPGHDVRLGDLTISRVLPVRNKRLVGPWCFLDRFGPLSFSGTKPMDVAPHPHIGLQTVTWLLDGEIIHGDSLGFEAVARPGSVNVMTAGGGIAHAEQTPKQNSGQLSGVQLWVALPDEVRKGPADFQHVAETPTVTLHGGIAQVFAGTLAGVVSPSIHHTPIAGAELRVHPGERLCFDISADFEHAVLLLDGDAESEGTPFVPHVLYYFGTGRTELGFSSQKGARLLFIGGPPFPETILMWWNFVARTPEEIVLARTEWEAGLRFGPVKGYDGASMAAPPLAKFAQPNPVS